MRDDPYAGPQCALCHVRLNEDAPYSHAEVTLPDQSVVAVVVCIACYRPDPPVYSRA